MEVKDRLINIIATTLNIDAAQIERDSDLVEDLGAESVDLAKLAIAIEDEFGVRISAEESNQLRNFAQIIAYLSRHQ